MTAVGPYALQERIDIGLHRVDIFTEFREESRSIFPEHRDSGIPGNRQNGRMSDDLSNRRREAFLKVQEELEIAGKIDNLNDWCEKAGLRWSTVGDFLSGRTRVPSDRTYNRLAAAVGISVAKLKGEPEAVTLTDLQRRFLAALEKLSDEQRRAELRALEARTAKPDEDPE
jgi:uncharacterized protein YjiS (DUF1127 family)